VVWVELDGERLSELRIPLRDDGSSHAVRIRLGTKEHPEGDEPQASLHSDEISRSPS